MSANFVGTKKPLNRSGKVETDTAEHGGQDLRRPQKKMKGNEVTSGSGVPGPSQLLNNLDHFSIDRDFLNMEDLGHPTGCIREDQGPEKNHLDDTAREQVQDLQRRITGLKRKWGLIEGDQGLQDEIVHGNGEGAEEKDAESRLGEEEESGGIARMDVEALEEEAEALEVEAPGKAQAQPVRDLLLLVYHLICSRPITLTNQGSEPFPQTSKMPSWLEDVLSPSKVPSPHRTCHINSIFRQPDQRSWLTIQSPPDYPSIISNGHEPQISGQADQLESYEGNPTNKHMASKPRWALQGVSATGCKAAGTRFVGHEDVFGPTIMSQAAITTTDGMNRSDDGFGMESTESHQCPLGAWKSVEEAWSFENDMGSIGECQTLVQQASAREPLQNRRPGKSGDQQQEFPSPHPDLSRGQSEQSYLPPWFVQLTPQSSFGEPLAPVTIPFSSPAIGGITISQPTSAASATLNEKLPFFARPASTSIVAKRRPSSLSMWTGLERASQEGRFSYSPMKWEARRRKTEEELDVFEQLEDSDDAGSGCRALSASQPQAVRLVQSLASPKIRPPRTPRLDLPFGAPFHRVKTSSSFSNPSMPFSKPHLRSKIINQLPTIEEEEDERSSIFSMADGASRCVSRTSGVIDGHLAKMGAQSDELTSIEELMMMAGVNPFVEGEEGVQIDDSVTGFEDMGATVPSWPTSTMSELPERVEILAQASLCDESTTTDLAVLVLPRIGKQKGPVWKDKETNHRKVDSSSTQSNMERLEPSREKAVREEEQRKSGQQFVSD